MVKRVHYGITGECIIAIATNNLVKKLLHSYLAKS